jgi:hypothetical protein
MFELNWKLLILNLLYLNNNNNNNNNRGYILDMLKAANKDND